MVLYTATLQISESCFVINRNEYSTAPMISYSIRADDKRVAKIGLITVGHFSLLSKLIKVIVHRKQKKCLSK